MSNVIDFLELMGQEPRLRNAPRSQLLEAMAGAGIDADLQSAILTEDGRALEALLGINASSCCLIHAPDEDEPEEAPDDGGDDDDKKDDSPTPKQRAFRHAAGIA